ncbi:hypothetical protein FHS07_001791 [Microbacterium proteolyticum]|uniref:Uncharacterized protein n=1 Tax=Microbacterium proteolyticum TaxID=1572644 RepID=A0A7W5GFQ1_9MICO|nr:hypothetical protein [Microbacterium proteolyticum]MBB3158095.1 hypothetical protein [Microbacterium proteolyticum]
MDLYNLLAEPPVLCRRDGDRAPVNLSVDEFSALAPGSLAPVIGIPSWIGKQSYEGRWWFSRTGHHVAFASTWERDLLTCLDYSGDATALVRDPAIFVSARTIRTPPLRPWLLIQKTDGIRVIPLNAADHDRSPELSEILAGSDVNVAIPQMPFSAELHLIRWLAGYRFTRFRLPDDIEQEVRRSCTTPKPLLEAVANAAASTTYALPTIQANLYSQMWRRAIELVNRAGGLSDTSTVRAA